MTRALVTQLVDALDELHGNCSGYFSDGNYDMQLAEKALTAAREYLATEPKQLGTLSFGGCPACGKQSCIARSCMTTEPSGERAELIARLNECLSGPAALTTREATAIKDAADMLEADAQQAKRVPMTEKQIDKIHANTARLAQRNTTFFIAFARALESHHKINAPK